ncbi:hypothetical protein KO353_04440 [Elioraea tepida]|uniref:Uncharacterized protein n=1 Tax=Elioraea tepida TaxID=2843330 RepID=A0A975U3U2_9PROT|nr:hypothetical protein [Elioraea tepida]QXM25482.1 hypothetical protein KO353_04440 [Elioraea tepida]
MTGHVVLITRDAETGFWHRIMSPQEDALDAAGRLEGVALLVDVDETARTVRLLRVIKGDGPARLHQWARLHRYRVIAPEPAPLPDPLALASTPRPLA